MTAILAWVAAVSVAFAAALSIAKNGIVVSKFIAFLADMRPTIGHMQVTLNAIAADAASASAVARNAESKAVEAVSVAKDVAERLSKHLAQQDRVMENHDAKLDELIAMVRKDS